jgi:uncharacterized protein YdeI (YjbR/CyaY-like superfamily)
MTFTVETQIPSDLAAWLDSDTREYFEALPRSEQRRYVDSIERASGRAAREWRVAIAVQRLRERRS